jgi:hypothetical protein
MAKRMEFDPPHKQTVNKTQRSVKRCPLVASAEITDIGSGTKLTARTSELSMGGCYIDTLNPFPEGTLIQLRILRDNGVFETKGKVAYSHERLGMGVAFTELALNQRSILESWLAEIVSDLRSTL